MTSRRTTIDLSYLTTEEALLIFEVLNDIASVLWEAHEPEIGHLAGLPTLHRVDLDERDPAIDDDDRLPF